jgi:ribosomal protein S18 acetylase RimI-like enzyme
VAGANGLRVNVGYRDATPADAAALDRVFDRSFCDAFAHLYHRDDLASFLSSFGLGDWEAQLNNPAFAFRVAEADAQMVGYVKLGPLKFAVETSCAALLLDQIYVLKNYHGIGIARSLIDWTIDEARRRGAEELYLTVYVDNERARRLYERYGFEVVGRYDFMVGSQADEDVIMRKML